VLVYPLYHRLVELQPDLPLYFAVGFATHIFHICVGIWALVAVNFPYVLRAAPVSLQACWVIFVITEMYLGGETMHLRRAVSWLASNFLTLLLPIMGAIYGWDYLLLVQCSVCIGAIFEAECWKWWYERRPEGQYSLSNRMQLQLRSDGQYYFNNQSQESHQSVSPPAPVVHRQEQGVCTA
jgi:uncharacterized membrane protein YwzB